MEVIERSVTVDKPLSHVWEYLSDFTSTNDWDPGTVSTECSSGDGGEGTVYRNTSKFLGKETHLTYTVRRYEPQHVFQVVGVNKTVTATDTITFEGDETRTKVTYRAEFELKGAAKLVSPVMSIPLKKLGDDAETNLKDALARI